MASLQNRDMKDNSRLFVVHPFNPPHILPLIEIVFSTTTNSDESLFAQDYADQMSSGHRLVVIHKELHSFFANKLSYVLFGRHATSWARMSSVRTTLISS